MRANKSCLVIILSLAFIVSSCKKETDDKMSDNSPLSPIYEDGKGVIDVEGNFYPSVIIGNQEWMAVNLRVTQFKNGVDIPQLSWDPKDENWQSFGEGTFVLPFQSEYIEKERGLRYTLPAARDTNCLCPEGWRLPSDADWLELELFLGMDTLELEMFGARGESDEIGEKLKSREYSISEESYGPVPVTNISGFSALIHGAIELQYDYIWDAGLGSSNFWTSSDVNSDKPICRILHRHTPEIARVAMTGGLPLMSVRCIRDE